MNRLLKNMKMSQVKQIRLRLFGIPFLCVLIGFILLFGCAAFLGEDAYLVALPFIVLYFVLQIGARKAPKMDLCLLEEELSSLREDQVYFVPKTEVRICKAWEEDVLLRCAELGFDGVSETDTDDAEAPLYFGYDVPEEFVFLYRTAILDEGEYVRIVADAKGKTASVLSPSDIGKSEFGVSIIVLVLADTVADEIAPKAKQYVDCLDGTMAFAFVDCGKNRVYMDGRKHSGFIEEDIIRIQKRIASLVFGENGRIPKDADLPSEEYIALYKKLDAQTYGEYLAEKQAEKDALAAFRSELAETLSDGEFCLRDNILYHKANGRLMHLELETYDEDETPIDEHPAVKGREIFCLEYFLRWTDSDRSLDKKDMEFYHQKMVQYLESLGYKVNPEDEDDEIIIK